jgi:hypothetical protein
MNNLPNIFVIGMSRVGKTPLADQLAEPINFIRISASEWVRSTFVPNDPANALAEITQLSMEKLKENPDVCVDFILDKYDVVRRGGFVIEGIRNPRDFALLFRPERDLVMFLSFPNNTLQPTEFEKQGIAVIRQMVDWMIQSRLLSSDRNMECVIAGLREDGDINSPMIMEFCNNLPQWDGHVFGRLASAMFQAEKWVACQLSKI